MSGPTTVIFTADPASVLLAASAIRAAQAIEAAYREAAAVAAGQADANITRRHEQGNAAAAGLAALAAERSRLEARFAAFAALRGEAAGTLPAPPPANDRAALIAYLTALRGLCATLGAIEAGRDTASDAEYAAATEAALADIDHTPLAAQLAEWEAAAAPQLPTLRRLLARIAPLGAVPEAMTALADQIARERNPERAALLLVELRRQVQARIEEATEEASALVLAQSLADLGYVVEDIPQTLFVEGGVVHFSRPGWGEHLVRMRVDAAGRRANFNVLRAVDGTGGADTERSVLDHLAEDRWCAEFPALLRALEARGLALEVTRRLEAGELPVQCVARDRLPCLMRPDEERRATPLRQRSLP